MSRRKIEVYSYKGSRSGGWWKVLLALVKFYRVAISPYRPPCCRYIPTCSQYALEAIEKYGALKGGWLALRRLLRHVRRGDHGDRRFLDAGGKGVLGRLQILTDQQGRIASAGDHRGVFQQGGLGGRIAEKISRPRPAVCLQRGAQLRRRGVAVVRLALRGARDDLRKAAAGLARRGQRFAVHAAAQRLGMVLGQRRTVVRVKRQTAARHARIQQQAERIHIGRGIERAAPENLGRHELQLLGRPVLRVRAGGRTETDRAVCGAADVVRADAAVEMIPADAVEHRVAERDGKADTAEAAAETAFSRMASDTSSPFRSMC